MVLNVSGDLCSSYVPAAERRRKRKSRNYFIIHTLKTSNSEFALVQIPFRLICLLNCCTSERRTNKHITGYLIDYNTEMHARV